MFGKGFFEDAVKLGSGARGMVASMVEEIEGQVKTRIEARFKKMNLVSREEFEVVKSLAEQARAKVEELEQRLAKQQGGQNKATTKKPATPKKKTPTE